MHHGSSFDDLDLTFRPVDELGPDQRWSTWGSCARTLDRGPEPRPDWVVTADAAVDTELGILKTGKEADAFLIERAVPGTAGDRPGERCLMVAKRYRDLDHRSFRRDDVYTAGRVVQGSREARAARKRSAFGRSVLAAEWARSEFDGLGRLWTAGVAVPYPVQLAGTELCMEFIGDGAVAAPRLQQTRPDPPLAHHYAEQLLDALRQMARLGYAHGDLSPYNVLADGERLVIIDVPQMVDLVANPHGMDLLHRDCVNICTWLLARGVPVDAEDWFAQLVAEIW